MSGNPRDFFTKFSSLSAGRSVLKAQPRGGGFNGKALGPTIQADEGERVRIVLSAGVFTGRRVLKAQPGVTPSGGGAIENGVKVLNLVAEPAKLRAGPTIQANEEGLVRIVLFAGVFVGQGVLKAQPRGGDFNGQALGPTIQANAGERLRIVLFAGRSVLKAQPGATLSGAGASENGVKVLDLVAEPAKLRADSTIHANEGGRVRIVLFAGRSVLKAQPGIGTMENRDKVLNLAAEPAKPRADSTIHANEGERLRIVSSAGVFAGRSVLKGHPGATPSGGAQAQRFKPAPEDRVRNERVFS